MQTSNNVVDGERVTQQQQSYESGYGDNNDALTTNADTAATLAVPQLLTRNMIPSLAITSLDAGDVIECYLLTRKSMLHGTAIQVTKSALGLRFRHRPATGRKYDDGGYTSSGSSSHTAAATGSRRRLELTIEYGPARAGTTLNHESIPHIILEDDPNADNTGNKNDDIRQTTASTTGVSWDNEGKVYFTESIDSDSYTSANYLASLSGTLLSKLLNSAVDFMQSGTATSINHLQQQQQIRRRRYQPFSVYLESSSQLKPSTDNTTTPPPLLEPVQILKSNSDADFIHHLFTILTELGVELKPVILPVATEIRLHAIDMKKIHIGVNNYPVDFYQKLLTCVKAIGSTDYSVYNISKAITTDVPTLSPSILEGSTVAFPSMIVRPPTLSVSSVSPILPPSKIRYFHHRLMAEGDATSVPTTPSDEVLTAEFSSHLPSTQTPNDTSIDVGNATFIPTISPTPDIDAGDDGGMDMATHQEQAATAAQHAQEAADAAGAADTEDEAVSAAQQAAVYAQKAATVTANQAALIAREAIISGVGSSVAQAVSLCFSDPLYGIANKFLNSTTDATMNEDISGMSATTVYLYWDGNFYYRMNLTAPYVTVASYIRPMPTPPSSRLGREDFVDWSVAFILVILSAVGFLLLLQHVMGRNLKLIRPLYRCQLWFFQPTHFDWDELLVESETDRGIGEEYTFGEDAIPLSMGGRKLGNKAAAAFKSGSTSSKKYLDDDWYDDDADHDVTGTVADVTPLVEMEMVDRSQQWTNSVNNNGTLIGSIFRKGTSFHSEKSFEGDTAPTPDMDGNGIVRMFRDPNLVDLPDLTSSSRVAMPVSSPLQII